jgi:hypothetical protein
MLEGNVVPEILSNNKPPQDFGTGNEIRTFIYSSTQADNRLLSHPLDSLSFRKTPA